MFKKGENKMKHKLTRLTSLLLAFIMAFSMLLVPVQAAEFSDVQSNSWYSEAVDYVHEKGWMTGTSETTFAPDLEVTRGMIVTVLAKIAGADLTKYAEPAFTDTKAGVWYTNACAWAAAEGLVAGVGDGRFLPKRNITRQDLVTILYKFIRMQEWNIPADGDRTYNDMESVAAYALDAVNFCAASELVTGYSDGGFHPKDTATRAQLAVILKKMDVLANGGTLPTDPMPAQSFNGAAGEDMSVSVNAPEGALPENTNMTVSRVNDVEDLASIQAKFEGDVMAAADISFSKDGAEIEPEKKVEVLISLQGLESINNPAVYHIKNDGTIELIYDVELVSVNRGGTKALRFYAKDFSVYVVIDKPIDELSRMRVNFINEWNGTTADAQLIAHMFVKNGDAATEDENYINEIIYDPGIGSYTPANDELFIGWSLSLKDKEVNGNDVSIADWGIKTLDNKDYEFDGLDYDEDSTPYTVEDIQHLLNEMAAKNKIVDGYVLNCYAVIMKIYTVTYLGEDQNVSLGSVSATLTKQHAAAGQHIFIELNQAYVPGDSQQNFEGWNVYSQGDHIVGAQYQGAARTAPYPNKTVLELSGSVTLSVYAPRGNWLTFKENGKGGTFNAPVFLKEGDTIQEKTADLLPMERKGYTFSHWCKNKNCTNDTDECPDRFVLQGTLTEDTTIYAHWIANTTARVTVIFWIQTPDGLREQYDTEHSKIIENGRVGENVNVTHPNPATSVTVTVPIKNDNGTNANQTITYSNINTNQFSYASSSDTSVEITPEGNTIVNIHLTRKKYTLTFTDPYNNQIVYGWDDYRDRWQTASISPNSSNNVNPTNTKTISGYTIGYTTSTNWIGYTTYTYYIKIGSDWFEITSNGSSVYNSSSFYHVGKRPGNNSTVYTIEALYGQNISSHFPIKLSNGIHYDIGERWDPQNDSVWTEVMVYVNTMPERNVSFECNLSTNSKKTMDYYVQALPNATAQENDITYQSKPYNRYHHEQPNYYGATEEDYLALYGFSKQAVTNQNGNALTLSTVQGADGTFYTYNGSIAETVRFIYTRDKYALAFFDGTCYDSNGVIPEENDGQYGTTTDYYYEEDLTEALKFEPTKTGYVFDGWYIDPGCTSKFTETKMDVGGFSLYAKWRQIEYRVFLHPNAKIEDEDGTLQKDTSLKWGADGNDDDATLSFKLGYGKAVSQLTGIRTEYEMVGWFLDEDCTIPYNQGSFEANDTTVTRSYDRTDPTELDKWGDPISNTNEDAAQNRYWITKRLDLYCLWRAKLVGADGIGVIYDATDEGNTPPTDSRLYKDKAWTAAQGASKPNDSSKTFLYWIVQRWDKDFQNSDEQGNPTTKGAYVDTNEVVYPGGSFQIRKSYAREIELPGSTEANPAFSYTMQLRAVYGVAEEQLPTHITWVGNGGVTADDKSQKASAEVRINEAVDIEDATSFTRAGYTFLGWARLEETESLKKKDDQGHIMKDEDGNDIFLSYAEATGNELTAADLWLVYNPADGRDPDSTPYYTVIEDGEIMVDDEGNAVHAEQVAADEKDPYNVLYAVWSRDLFYVFHSSTGIMQAFEVPVTQVVSDTVTKFEALPFDITALVPAGYLYGGYYMTYGGVSQSLVDTAVNAYTGNAAGWNMSTNTYSFQAGAGFEAYTGNNAKSSVTGGNFWTKSMAYKVEDDMSAAQKAAVNGETMLPQNGTVYYLKEVPKAYLANMFFYVYDDLNYEVDEEGNEVTDENGNPVKAQTLEDLYFISVIDDAYYKTIGYKIADGVNDTEGKDMMAEVLNKDITKRTTLARSVKFLQQNAGPVDPATGKPTNLTTIIKPKKASDDGEDVIEFGINGYLEVVQLKKAYFNEHKKFTVRPTWETLDGVAVSGTTALGVTIGENGKITDDDFGSKLYDYQRIYIDLSNAKFKYKNSDDTGNTWFTDENWYGDSDAKTVIQFRDVAANKYAYKELTVNSETKIGYVDVPDGYKEMILVLCGVNSAVGEDIWSQFNKWAQTVALAIHTNKNYISSFYGYAGNVAVPPTDNNTVWSHYETD